MDPQTDAAVTWLLNSGEPAIQLMTRRDVLGDQADALDELERRRLADGRWRPGGRWWKPPGGTISPEVVDWGQSGPNEMITLNALRVLKAAGRLALPRSRHALVLDGAA
jgi:hypothetical protein